jgi:5,10-methylenetetrahydromethanopterin reductase
MRETVQLLRSWWQAPYRASSASGDHFQVRDWERVLVPQVPPPIYLAAAGPRGLALAGELCDGAIFNVLTSMDAIREAIPLVRKAATEAGRDPSSLAFVLRTNVEVVETGLDERKALDRAKNLIALIATLPGMSRLFKVSGFDHEAIVVAAAARMRTEQVLARGGGFPELRRSGNLAEARQVIPDEFVRNLALIGNLEDTRARLQELAAIGITHVGVRPPADAASVDDWRRLLRDLR